MHCIMVWHIHIQSEKEEEREETFGEEKTKDLLVLCLLFSIWKEISWRGILPAQKHSYLM